MKRIVPNASLLLLSVFVSLLLGESVFRIREHRRNAAPSCQPVPDALLELRTPAYCPGHDAWGFRNLQVPSHADIVAIGDSQTWGYNAGRDQAWPQALAAVSRHSVYNMGAAGYGPVQYWVLARRAQAFTPRVLVIGVYFGNDLFDAYHLAYTNGHYAEMRSPGSGDLATDTITPRVHAASAEWTRELESGCVLDSMSTPVRGYSALVRAWSGFHRPRCSNSSGLRWASNHPDRALAYDDGRVRTIFTTAYRLEALDLDEPRIAEGLRLTDEMLARIRKEAAAQGVMVLVALLPTKELAFTGAAGQAPANVTLRKLIGMESKSRGRVMDFCAAHQIMVVDLLPSLTSAILRGEQLYLTSGDGHPNSQGYAVIASAISRSLDRLGWLQSQRP